MLQITFHGVPHSDAIAESITRHAHHLQQLRPAIDHIRAAVEAPHQHHRAGNHFRLHLEIVLPGGEIVVGRGHDDDFAEQDLHTLVGQVFAIAARKLGDHARRRAPHGAPG